MHAISFQVWLKKQRYLNLVVRFFSASLLLPPPLSSVTSSRRCRRFISTGSLSGIMEPLSPDPLLALHVNICHSQRAEVHRFPSFGKQTYYYNPPPPTGGEGGVLWLVWCVNRDGFILVWCCYITVENGLKIAILGVIWRECDILLDFFFFLLLTSILVLCFWILRISWGQRDSRSVIKKPKEMEKNVFTVG